MQKVPSAISIRNGLPSCSRVMGRPASLRAGGSAVTGSRFRFSWSHRPLVSAHVRTAPSTRARTKDNENGHARSATTSALSGRKIQNAARRRIARHADCDAFTPSNVLITPTSRLCGCASRTDLARSHNGQRQWRACWAAMRASMHPAHAQYCPTPRCVTCRLRCFHIVKRARPPHAFTPPNLQDLLRPLS